MKKTCTFNNSIDCIVIDTSEQALPFCSLGTGVQYCNRQKPRPTVINLRPRYEAPKITKYTHRPVQYTTETAINCVQLLFTEKKEKKSVTESDV